LVIDLGIGDIVPSQFLSNITTISELQISHPHIDHFHDISAMSRKNIKSFRCPILKNFTDQVMGWKILDRAKVAKLREMKSSVAADNDAVKTGNGFRHTVWFPQNRESENPNTASVVTTLEYQGVKVLLGGDLPAAGWEDLLNNADFRRAISGTTIFKVPHHGRKEGCCQALFDMKEFMPSLCIISDKALVKDPKNRAATDWYSKRARGCNVEGYVEKRKVLSTRLEGSIFVKINEERKWWVYPNRKWIDS